MPTTSTGADVNGSDLMDIYRMNLGDPNYLPWKRYIGVSINGCIQNGCFIPWNIPLKWKSHEIPIFVAKHGICGTLGISLVPLFK